MSSGTSWRSAAWIAIGVEAELGEDLGRGDRMGDVRLAGRALLALVGVDGQVERLARPARGRRRVVLGEDRGVRARARSASRSACGRCRCAVGTDRRRPARAAADARSAAASRPGSWRVAVVLGHRPQGYGVSRSRARRSAASASARSSHGIGPSGPMIARSWPLPASSTMSPGRARSKAASMAARRSAIDQQVVVAPLADGLRATRDLVEDASRILAARVLVGDDDDPGTLAGDPAHQRALGGVALAGRAEDRDQAAAARGGRAARAGRARSGATPGCGRSRR